jgi:CubicO group peptidase (beta-lactamase class C family)
MMARAGITSVHDAYGTPEDLRAYQDARQAGSLAVRVYCLIGSNAIDRMIAGGVRTGLGDEWVRVGAMQMTCGGVTWPVLSPDGHRPYVVQVCRRASRIIEEYVIAIMERTRRAVTLGRYSGAAAMFLLAVGERSIRPCRSEKTLRIRKGRSSAMRTTIRAIHFSLAPALGVLVSGVAKNQRARPPAVDDESPCLGRMANRKTIPESNVISEKPFAPSGKVVTTRWRCSLLLGVVLFHTGFASATAQTRSADTAIPPGLSRVQTLIEQRIATNRIPSVSVAVGRSGKIAWERGFGWADLERRVPASEHTMYWLASVTKLITATAVMVLQERKQINLNRPVNDYLGPAKLISPVWNPSEATVRRVATHTAGLATYDDGYACRGDEADCQDEMIRRFGVVIWRPGERFDYSNLGYGVLGDAIRHVSGMTYGEFLTREVFTPLGMTHCSLGVRRGLERFAAERYNSSDGTRVTWSPNGPESAEAASSVFCSAHDLVRFGMFHLKENMGGHKSVLSSPSIDQMQNSAVSTGDGYKYGFGWWHEERFGCKVMYVSGGNPYTSALLFTVPSERIAVAILMNTGASVAQEIADEIVSALVAPESKNRASAAQGKQKRSDPKPSTQVSFAGIWTGAIHTETGKVPLTLSIPESGAVRGILGLQPFTVLDRAEYREKQLRARIRGNLNVDQTNQKKNINLELEMFLRGGVLNGGVTMVPLSGPEWGKVTYFVQLDKNFKQRP